MYHFKPQTVYSAEEQTAGGNPSDKELPELLNACELPRTPKRADELRGTRQKLVHEDVCP